MNLFNNTKEHFKPIKGYEGLYEVSNLGNIKGLKRNIILKPFCDPSGYNGVVLCKDGKVTFKYIHRLIAMDFIPNLENKPQVNHINGVKNDNRIENLEWCTHKENAIHAQRIGLCDAGNKANSKAKSKQTLDLYTGIIYDSLKIACESLNLNVSTQISRISRNNNKRLQYC